VLDQFSTRTTLPVSDLERAKAWYKDKLGLTPKSEDLGGAQYQTGGTSFALFPTPFAGTAKNTAMEWAVDDTERVVAELKSRGVTFDHYDIPGVEWNGDVAIMGGYKGAWFKDSEGNIIGVNESAES
jgi:catechol 2,3-dioxygenase-like lactoylglutathione lyase family enzyme